MLWVLAFHIIFVVCWFAALFYLPRLFVYHADTNDAISLERFKIMERRLLFGIMWPSGILTTIFGVWLVALQQSDLLQAWLQIKLLLVMLLWLFHFACHKVTMDFARDKNTRSSKFYRFFNEVPSVLLVAIVILVVVKP